MNNVIFRRIPPVDRALVERAKAFSVADLHEALPLERSKAAIMSSRMRPVVRGLRIVGPAVTSCDSGGNNLMMHKALSLAPAGSVLVVTSHGARGALWGELAATYARKVGVEGIVVDGNVRDVEDLEAMRFPAWATEISPLRSDKKAAGAVNIPVMCGDVLVHPGDIVAADADGVVVIRPDELEGVLQRAGERMAREDALRRSLQDGGSLFESMRLQDVIDGLEIKEIDGHWHPDA